MQMAANAGLREQFLISSEGAVTRGNFSCNLIQSRNFVATHSCDTSSKTENFPSVTPPEMNMSRRNVFVAASIALRCTTQRSVQHFSQRHNKIARQFAAKSSQCMSSNEKQKLSECELLPCTILVYYFISQVKKTIHIALDM